MSTLAGPSDVGKANRYSEPPRGELLSPKDIGAILGVHTGWVYEAVKRGDIKAVRLGKYIRFTRADVDSFIEKQKA